MVTFNMSPSGITSNVHVLLHLEQAKLAIVWCVVSRNGWKTQVLLISTGLAWVMQGVRLIDSNLCNHVVFTDVAAPIGCWQLFEQNRWIQEGGA
jgi:hypothetical protein